MSKNDGGPAFPSIGEGFGNPNYSAPGMSLRDYFAGQALVTTLRSTDAWDNPAKAAAWAYDFADAMIAEKLRRETEDGRDQNHG